MQNGKIEKIGESIFMQLKRFEGNPILVPRKENRWESDSIFNAGAVYSKGSVHLLYRAMGPENVSTLGYASSRDGFHIDARPNTPAFAPEAGNKFETFGCEDPRITQIGDQFYILYTAYSRIGTRVSLASTKDFKTYRRYGVVLPDVDDKDAALFPEKIRGKYVMVHRIEPDMWVAYSDNLTKWEGHKVVMRIRKGEWDGWKIGAGAQPIKTKKGWLMFYHGVDENKVYRLGVALLDLNDPLVVLARCDKPILEPEKDYELQGRVPNVVFTCGAVEKDGLFYVYYGGADKVIGVATIGKDTVLESLE